MGKPTGFKEIERKQPGKRPIEERTKDYEELLLPMTDKEIEAQGARCMDCGVPFCHNSCPLNNIIPECNDLLYKGLWKEAYEKMTQTNDFPEFTGKICPALCEGSCVLGLAKDEVSIRLMEVSLADKAYKEGWVKHDPPPVRTGKKIAIIGSGPAGLATAIQLNRVGHEVTVFEKADRFGGILMYGIPHFKLDKKIVQRRIDLMQKEGILFQANTDVGTDYSVEDLKKNFDAICLSGGSTIPRDLPVEGRDLKGIHFAMDFLPQQNKRSWGDRITGETEILATGKNVVVIGGGDTGSDCVGTSVRQGAKSICNFELLPAPPASRATDNPWPEWPKILRVSSSHDEAETEGVIREYCILTKRLIGDENGNLKKLQGVKVEWKQDEAGKYQMNEIPGTEFERDVDLILLAMGFLYPEKGKLLEELEVKIDQRGNVKVDEKKQTSVKGVFCVGDMESGQSLVVRAIAAGRIGAKRIDEYLTDEESTIKAP